MPVTTCQHASATRKNIPPAVLAKQNTAHEIPLSLDQVLFDVAQVPVEAVIGGHGSTRRIHAPGKKALVNTLTDLAARPPENPLFQKGRDTLESGQTCGSRAWRRKDGELGLISASG